MQVFSKLQRSSTNYIYKLVFFIALLIFNSNYYFFPILIGYILICEEFVIAIIYLLFFSYFHSITPLYLYMILAFDYLTKDKLKKILESEFRRVFFLIVIYLILLFQFADIKYIIYNFAIDFLMVKRCGQK